jgi:hypothetical protein
MYSTTNTTPIQTNPNGPKESKVLPLFFVFICVGVICYVQFFANTSEESNIFTNSEFATAESNIVPVAKTSQPETRQKLRADGHYFLEMDVQDQGKLTTFNFAELPVGAKYIIDFGDGTPQCEVTNLKATHIYTKIGEFQAKLFGTYQGNTEYLGLKKVQVASDVEFVEENTEIDDQRIEKSKSISIDDLDLSSDETVIDDPSELLK